MNLDDLETQVTGTARDTTPGCAFGKMLRDRADLTDDDKALLRRLVADHTVSADVLNGKLNERGANLPKGTIKKHRNLECSCDKAGLR